MEYDFVTYTSSPLKTLKIFSSARDGLNYFFSRLWGSLNLEMLLDRILNIFITYKTNKLFDVLTLFSAYLKLMLIRRVV